MVQWVKAFASKFNQLTADFTSCLLVSTDGYVRQVHTHTHTQTYTLIHTHIYMHCTYRVDLQTYKKMLIDRFGKIVIEEQ